MVMPRDPHLGRIPSWWYAKPPGTKAGTKAGTYIYAKQPGTGAGGDPNATPKQPGAKAGGDPKAPS